jgi:diguanylate cyclase (GGDEF)-like protein
MATPLQHIEASSADAATRYQVAGDSSATMQLALGLSRALQTSLDPTRLVDLFSDHMQGFVTHDGMLYRNDALDIQHRLGGQGRHRCTYSLNIGDEPLGELVFCRSRKFTAAETALMEDYLCYLLYPLRNALLYQTALNMAQKDPLTGVYNRGAMDEALRREIDFSRRQSGNLSLVILDIDLFKNINDDYGHIIGDCVLKAVANSIQDCMRSADQLFRYGGEEFVVLMRDTDAKGACLLAERIRKAVESLPCHCSGADIPVTISAGVSTLREEDTPLALFDQADQALYLAKQEGRNQVRCASKDL